MNTNFQYKIKESIGASRIFEIEVIQNLWSGYGKIVRYGLEGAVRGSVVVKHVRLPKSKQHPRGWNTDLSHDRKVKSYEVEMAWYEHYSELCDAGCRIPKCLALETQGDEVLMVLEDLDDSGYPSRKTSVSWDEIKACLKWLANFHATFLHHAPKKLWSVGTYWHLATRPDELDVLDDQALKSAALQIDKVLNESPYLTLVHGDAKLANFCFSSDGKEVAAVDFQYVGGGCGMKDVAYFIGSCLYEDDCEEHEGNILDIYFKELNSVIKEKRPDINAESLEHEWRKLFPVAWTDFHRFIKGWSPGHWKINSYSERLAKQVIQDLSH